MLIETDIFGNVRDKVQMAIDRIREFEPPEGYFVAFSGGKDSVVILDLVKRSGVKFDAHYNITGIDPPELFYFIRDGFPEVQRHRPEMTMWALIIKKGFPPSGRAKFCCEYLKERGGENRRVLTGIRWAESVRRGKREMVEACFKDTSKIYVHPIIDWSKTDVWDYIHENSLPYCGLYDEGWDRIGCLLCPCASVKKREAAAIRYPKYKQKFIKTFEKAIHAHPNMYGAKTGEAMFKWWMKDRYIKKDPDQTVMFE